ncbi:hypothetical protein CCACVL1_00384 [Corchorus capsularis]|uniref:Uncharacterized protein n=1 Tax=Corchorus capsularis TaxID=210143 RepID=A0A1R3KX19_COCAP|nr:hypothetical protein CCACVL1_00384 [Corchorus capsularis]
MNNKVRKLDHTATYKQHEVIRTKAVKCSKAVNVNVNIPFFSNDYNNLDHPKFENTNIASDHSSSSALNVVDDINSIDFLVDFDINELLAPDDSIPDFHIDQIHDQQVDENGDHNINGKYEINGLDQIHELSKSVDEAGVDLDDFFQQASTKTIMDLPSIASYLNLEDHDEYWIY